MFLPTIALQFYNLGGGRCQIEVGRARAMKFRCECCLVWGF